MATARSSSAQTPIGTPLKTFPWRASRLLADPARPRLYAALPKLNAVAVIDTDTLQVLATVPVGAHPGDLALSRNGRRLYVANQGVRADSVAVSVINTNTLQALPGIDLPTDRTWSLAVGRNNQLYVASIGQGGGLFQVDLNGQISPQRIDTGDYRSVYLQIDRAGKTLYAAGGGTISLDVSGPVAAVSQSVGWVDDDTPDELRLSHDGRWLCRPDASYSSITLYQTKDLSQQVGTLDMDDEPGPMAFSPDDTRIYELPQVGLYLWIFDTETFARTEAVTLPWKVVESNRGSYRLTDVTTDGTGHRLFVSGTSSNDVDATLVIATGTDASTVLPGVSVWANTPEVSAGASGSFSLSRSGDLSKVLEVNYTLGSRGPDGNIVPGPTNKFAFPAGKAITEITLPFPVTNRGGTATLKLKLLPGPGYSVVRKSAKMLVYF